MLSNDIAQKQVIAEKTEKKIDEVHILMGGMEGMDGRGGTRVVATACEGEEAGRGVRGEGRVTPW